MSTIGNLSTTANMKQSVLLKRKFSNDVEMEYDNLQPYFFESDVSEDNALSFYDSSIAFPECWRKFNLHTSRHAKTPTPTPIVTNNRINAVTTTLVDDYVENSCTNNNNNLSSIESTVDISCILKRIRTESLSAVSHHQQQADIILRKDSMWSAPGLEALGFGAKGSSTSENQGQKQHHDFDIAARATPTMHMLSGDISDYSDYSDDECEDSTCGKVPSRCDEQADDVSAAAEESDVTDDDEEVDVVSVNKSQQGSAHMQDRSQLFHSALALHRSTSLPLPTAASVITADVAAMHNYFSTPSHIGVKSGSSTVPLTLTPAAGSSSASINRRRSTGGPIATSLLVKRQKPNVTASATRPRHVSRIMSSSGSALRHHHVPATQSGAGMGGCGQRRELHNVLERKRRDDLRGSFNGLRDLLPMTGAGGVQAKERLAKVTILRRSCDYIRSLRRSFHDLSAEMNRLKSRQGELRARLKELEQRAAADSGLHRS